MEPKHKWRVIIIMAHDGETYFEYNDLEQSILDQETFDNLSYVFFYYNQKYNRISIKDVCIEEKRRYLRERPETQDFVNSDFYNSNTLIRFLQFVKAMEIQENEEDIIYHYFMITWGHGGGLFYFPSGSIDDLLKKIGLHQKENKQLIETIKNGFQENLVVYTQMCSNFSNKDNHGFQDKPFPFLTIDMFHETELFTTDADKRQLDKILNDFNKTVAKTVQFYTATDLNTIFKAGLGYIDLYFALNCYTQMLETGYELRHSVNMMVAPQTTMPLPGINYSEVFAKLEETPDISLSVLSKTICDSYDNKYTGEFMADFMSRYPKFPFNTVSFSCNFLKEYQQLIESLNQLTDLIRRIYTTPEFEPYIRNVSVARRRCGDLTPDNNYGIIDLNNFLIQLQFHLPGIFNDEITAIKAEFEHIRTYVRTAIRIPGTGVAAPGKTSDNPLFLSFFAPAFVESDFINYLLKMYSLSNNEYTRESGWDNFVECFYNDTISVL